MVACPLKISPVTMDAHPDISESPNQRFETPTVIIAPSNREKNDIFPLRIHDSAEIRFFSVGAILHLCSIRTPLLIDFVGGEISVQNIFAVISGVER